MSQGFKVGDINGEIGCVNLEHLGLIRDKNENLIKIPHYACILWRYDSPMYVYTLPTELFP